jgi:hypothetical protein
MFLEIVQAVHSLVPPFYSGGSSTPGTYEPLCPDDWDIGVLNLSVVSYGRQFDRLGVNRLSGLINVRASGLETQKSGELVQPSQFGRVFISPTQKTSLCSSHS